MPKGSKEDRAILMKFVRRYPVVWRGNLALKDAQAMVMMHCISGNVKFARSILRRNEVDPTPMKITHKRRLIPEALKEVIQKIKIHDEHCVLLAIPCGTTRNDANPERRKFRSFFLNYLKAKNCMGIVKGAHSETNQTSRKFLGRIVFVEFVAKGRKVTHQVTPITYSRSLSYHHYRVLFQVHAGKTAFMAFCII
ncbi:hypothetical protein TNCV_776471 [Trichonephila clavipes]|nr:hypothetical protein TNCV_776471 [Trichonephila clavipes]